MAKVCGFRVSGAEKGGELKAMFRYSWVEPDADRRALARIAGHLVAHDLRLEPIPTIQFFDKDATGSIFYKHDVAGFIAEDGRLIGIHIGLIPQATFATIAHEMRHCWQHRHGLTERTEAVRERDAWLYERSWPLYPRSISLRQLIESLGRVVVEAIEGRDILWSDADSRRRVRVVVSCGCDQRDGVCMHRQK
jgi:hypothetical protein